MALSDECERKGWLRKFQDTDGEILWDLTPAGRQRSTAPALNSRLNRSHFGLSHEDGEGGSFKTIATFTTFVENS
jgi:hypothetical protein